MRRILSLLLDIPSHAAFLASATAAALTFPAWLPRGFRVASAAPLPRVGLLTVLAQDHTAEGESGAMVCI